MILYINGDSHSAGHDAGGPEFAYGKHVANALNYDYICDAEPGCSNRRILDKTNNYLKTNRPDFLIIGWSTWERDTWYHNGQAHNITASGEDVLPAELRDAYKQWVIDQFKPDVQQQQEFKAHNEIWELHQTLVDSKIPHLFFNCFHYFFYIERHNLTRFDWGNFYLDPYSQQSTYYHWLENNGYTPANPKFYHYGADAHLAWAEHLLPKIKSIIDSK